MDEKEASPAGTEAQGQVRASVQPLERKPFRWPWVSRLVVDVLERNIGRLEADLYYERNRWLSLVNAERAMVDKLQNVILGLRSPSGLHRPFVPGEAEVPPPAQFSGPIRPHRNPDTLVALAQEIADRHYREAVERGELPDPVPGMTDPNPPPAKPPEAESEAS